MASITRQANGRRLIQFTNANGVRRTMRLGKVSQRAAEAVRIRIENLISAALTGHSPDDETSRWVAGLDQLMTEKLAAAGLIAKGSGTLLGPFLDAYVQSRTDTKASTHLVYGHTRRNLIAFFGAEKPLGDVTPGDADAFRIFLAGHEKLAENTVRRRMGIAKQFFRAATRKKLIPENPFEGQTCMVRENRARSYFITPEEAHAVLDACPDEQWRLIFALCRWGGLRCPSEVLRLKWEDVDWNTMKLTVHASKTEHHADGGIRQVPIFPELLPHLRDAFEEAEDGSVYTVSRYRDASVNLRTQLTKIIRRAGLNPWPKLFQNLRSTRETELAEKHPLHVVCAWIGNSPQVAAKHYLQVTEAHFQKASADRSTLGNAVQPAQSIDLPHIGQARATLPQPVSLCIPGSPRQPPREPV